MCPADRVRQRQTGPPCRKVETAGRPLSFKESIHGIHEWEWFCLDGELLRRGTARTGNELDGECLRLATVWGGDRESLGSKDFQGEETGG
ncbi:MAG: hypothetical protein LBQ15_03710 [Clostridium sp.]|jgi:hypothetical protein|nr:hypothetical protein [Clostridium sp.]